jgi:hypothetical protein
LAWRCAQVGIDTLERGLKLPARTARRNSCAATQNALRRTQQRLLAQVLKHATGGHSARKRRWKGQHAGLSGYALATDLEQAMLDVWALSARSTPARRHWRRNTMSDLPAALPEAVRSLAEADFSAVAQRFTAAGFAVAEPADGIITIKAAGPRDAARPAVLVSVGVHGDETGPIEVVAICWTPVASAFRAGGRPDAVRRQYRRDPRRQALYRCGLEPHVPRAARYAGRHGGSARADVMIAATTDFFNDAGPVRWHLDLHTAIRPSVYPTFAIVPELIADQPRTQLIDWLVRTSAPSS